MLTGRLKRYDRREDVVIPSLHKDPQEYLRPSLAAADFKPNSTREPILNFPNGFGALAANHCDRSQISGTLMTDGMSVRFSHDSGLPQFPVCPLSRTIHTSRFFSSSIASIANRFMRSPAISRRSV